MGRKLIVEFETDEDAEAFLCGTARCASVFVDGISIDVVGVLPYRGGDVRNSASGNIANNVQCGNIDGGVSFTSDRSEISDRWYPR
jgi:hypothetical protein